MEKHIREPINGITHMIGAVLSLFALVAMISKVWIMGGSKIVLGSVIFFGVSMILLYSASATYHSVMANEKIIKRFNDICTNCWFLCSVLFSCITWKNWNEVIFSSNNMCSNWNYI